MRKIWKTKASATRCMMFFVAGLLLVVGIQWAMIWLDDVRLVAITEDTLANNPQAAENASLLSRLADTLAQAEPLPAPKRELVGVPLSDPEWETLPRTTFVLEGTVDDLALVAKDLYRNTEANPNDVYVGLVKREGLQEWLPSAVGRISDLRKAVTAIAHQEFDVLVRRGNAHAMTYDAYLQQLDEMDLASVEKERAGLRTRLTAQGVDEATVDRAVRAAVIIVDPRRAMKDPFMHGTRDGRVVWTYLREMPQTSEASTLLHAATMEFYATIMEYFHEHAGLNDVHVRRIMGAVEIALSRNVPR